MARPQPIQPPNPQTPFVVSPGGQLQMTAVNFLTKIIKAINGTETTLGTVQVLLGNGITISSGIGSPAGVLAGNIGDLYTNAQGGANLTLWVKESGSGTASGWEPK